MKKTNKPIVAKICGLVGIALLVMGILVFSYHEWSINSWQQKSQNYVETLRTLIPEPQGAVPEERRDNRAPVIAIDEIDFIGILEMPQHKLALPVAANWEDITKHPCKFSGSIYNQTLKIGATSQKGQYDFYRKISIGDTVIFTDAEGNRYTYAVTDLQYKRHVNQTTLNNEKSALTLFIKNVYDFNYLIIYCNIAN